jgi:hypothetical protein
MNLQSSHTLVSSLSSFEKRSEGRKKNNVCVCVCIKASGCAVMWTHQRRLTSPLPQKSTKMHLNVRRPAF